MSWLYRRRKGPVACNFVSCDFFLVSYTASCCASHLAFARLAIHVGVHKRGAVTRIERVPVWLGTARRPLRTERLQRLHAAAHRSAVLCNQPHSWRRDRRRACIRSNETAEGLHAAAATNNDERVLRPRPLGPQRPRRPRGAQAHDARRSKIRPREARTARAQFIRDAADARRVH